MLQPWHWVCDLGKGLQRCGPRMKPSNVLGSVGECEGMNHTLPNDLPFWELESRWCPKSLKVNFRDQNSWD
jgi:hypothetical protein